VQLEAQQAGAIRETIERVRRTIDARWRREMPFVPRGIFMLMGPSPDPVNCAGLARSGDPECAHDWDDALQTER
jgi:hypothetical protein